jgi:hypothetical protein
MNKTGYKSTKKSHRRKSNTATYLIIAGASLAVIVLVIFLVQGSVQPTSASGLLGDAVQVDSRDHVPVDTVPGPYHSNPPAGGAHYPEDFPAKFYQETDLTSLPKYPEGYLVHSLEHGYVIFWYNCNISGTNCASLKQSIQNVINNVGATKIIAFPWTTMDVPLAITSWGRILKMPTVDETVMRQFVVHNRLQAPEPDAP